MSKMEQNYLGQSKRMSSMSKMKLNCQDRFDMVQSMMQNRQNNDVIDCIMRFTPKTKVTCHGQSDKVWSMTKMRQDNDVTNRKGLVYAKIKTELS